MFQDPRLLPWATVLDNVVLGLRGRDAEADAAARRSPRSASPATSDDWPKTLSGGEAQRAALARALVREPDLLLLDEPFGALDALTRIRMHALVQQLCARHRPAVLLVTHDVDEAILLADRVLVLTDGVHLARRARRRPEPPPARRRPRSSPSAPACSPSSASTRPPKARHPSTDHRPARPHDDDHHHDHSTADHPADLDVTPALRHHRRRDPRRRPAATLDDATVAAIRQVWLDRKVVFFPGQHLDPDRAPRVRRAASASRPRATR